MDETPNKCKIIRSSKTFIVLTIAYAVFTDCFLYAVMVPMLPSVLQKKGFEKGVVQIVITSMLGVFGMACFFFSVPCGWYSDRYPLRRTPFLLGLVVLLLATVVLWVAAFVHRVAFLALTILGRVLQGVASAVVFTTGLAVLVDTVDEGEVAEYAGWINLALNFGNVAGPLLGGVLYQYGGVHAVFGACMFFIGIDFLLRLIMKERPRRPTAIATPGVSSDSGSLESKEATTVMTSNPTDSSSSGTETASLVRHSASTKAKVPVFLRLLCSKRFCASLWGVFVLAIVFTAFDTVLPIFVEEILGWNTLYAGLIFLPFSLPALLGIFIGKLTDTFGGRWFVFTSFLALCPGLVALRFVEKHAAADIAILVVLLLLVGFFMTVILEPLFAEFARRGKELQEYDARAGRDVRNGYYAQAYALFNMAWSLGNTVGPVMIGFIMEAGGWTWAITCLGTLCGLTSIPLVLCMDGWVLAGHGERSMATWLGSIVSKRQGESLC